ncbi:heavy-metal-associated domain-containing protein [Candidatus Latescibacterota bacterium]
MEEKTVHIPAISCGHCVMTIKRELGDLDGVSVVDGDPEAKTITVTWEAPQTWETIVDTLQDIGFSPESI